MAGEPTLDRRRVLAAGMGLLASAPPLAALMREEGKEGKVGEPEKPGAGINPDEGVTAPEDLMKEHGVLNRCLLIYEEGMRRIAALAGALAGLAWGR